MNETTNRKNFKSFFCSFLAVACNFSSRYGREKSAERMWDVLKGISWQLLKAISLEQLRRRETTTDECFLSVWVDRTLASP